MQTPSKPSPDISIVIPTHNRQDSLRRLLDGLERQTYPSAGLEVVVVCNACTDGTQDMLRTLHPPYCLQVVEQPDLGPGNGRNQGTSRARGELLIFLDDDIEPSPGLVESHVKAHRQRSGIAVMGYLPPVLELQRGFFKAELRRWWEAKFFAMGQTGHRFTYHDLLSGNFSILRDDFMQAGGFDPALRACFDDLEFGIRLLKSGIRFKFAIEAWGCHHENRDLDGLLRRKFQEGLAEVHIGERHPEVIPTLFTRKIAEVGSPVMKFLVALVFRLPGIGDWLTRGLRLALPALEWARLRRPWRFLLDGLMIYWHMRGVSQKLQTPAAWSGFIESPGHISREQVEEVKIDISEGLEAAAERLEEMKPPAARIYYKGHFLARIPQQGGAEPLRGEHLAPFLSDYYPVPVLRALALDGVLGQTEEVERLIAGSNWILNHLEPVEQ
jgi:GT2 family glycosyltransferase